MILSIPWTIQAQADSPYQFLNRTENVICLTLNTTIEDFIDGTLELDDVEITIEGDAERIELSIVSDEANTNEVYHKIKSFVRDAHLEQIVVEDEDDGKGQLYIWVKRNGSKVSTIHFMVMNDDGGGFVFASVHGDFTVED